MHDKTHKRIVRRVRPLGHVLLRVQIKLAIAFFQVMRADIGLMVVSGFSAKTVKYSECASQPRDIISRLLVQLTDAMDISVEDIRRSGNFTR